MFIFLGGTLYDKVQYYILETYNNRKIIQARVHPMSDNSTNVIKKNFPTNREKMLTSQIHYVCVPEYYLNVSSLNNYLYILYTSDILKTVAFSVYMILIFYYFNNK